MGKEESAFEKSVRDVPTERVYDVGNRNKANVEGWLRTWLTNYRLNAPHITEDFTRRDANVTGAALPKRDLTRAIICGSGPSLEQIGPHIRDWNGLLICGPTNVGFCLAHGRAPDYIILIDASPEHWVHMKRLPIPPTTTVCLPPNIDVSVTKLFPGNRHWFKSRIQNEQYEWFNLATECFFTPIKNYMLQAGCTANQEIILLQLFKTMKMFDTKEIYLCGVDFAYHPDASRVSYYRYQENIDEYVRKPPKAVRTRARTRTAENGMLTDRSMIGYKRSLYVMWYSLNKGDNELNLYNLSDGITGEIPRPFPTCPLHENISKVFRGETPNKVSNEYIEKTFTEYMNRNQEESKATHSPKFTWVRIADGIPRAGEKVLLIDYDGGKFLGSYNRETKRFDLEDGTDGGMNEFVQWCYV